MSTVKLRERPIASAMLFSESCTTVKLPFRLPFHITRISSLM